MHDLNFVVQLAMDAKERPEEWVNICENIVYGKDLGIDKSQFAGMIRKWK